MSSVLPLKHNFLEKLLLQLQKPESLDKSGIQMSFMSFIPVNLKQMDLFQIINLKT